MTYEAIKLLNDKKKQQFEEFEDSGLKQTSHDRAICEYKFVETSEGLILKNNIKNIDGVNVIKVFVKNLNVILNYLNYGLNYITNISVLKRHKEVFKYMVYKELLEFTVARYKNLINKDLKGLYFKLVPNLDFYIGKGLLVGANFLFNKDHCIVCVYHNDNLYLVSDCMLIIDIDKPIIFSSLKYNELYIESLDITSINSIAFWFENSTMESITLKNFDTSNIENMSCLFSGCKNLKKIVIDNKFDTSRVIDFSFFFNNCVNLKDFDFNFLNMCSAKILSGMFYGCSSIEELDLSSWVVPNLENIGYFIQGCKNLKSLKCSDFIWNKISLSDKFLLDLKKK